MGRVKGKKPPLRPKPTACNDCGQCCDPVTLAIGPDKLDRYPEAAATLDPVTLEWIRTELTPVAKPDWLPPDKIPMVRIVVGDRVIEAPAGFYECASYDKAGRRCTRYETRPDVCREYPWYGGERDGRAALPPACDFNRDVGREPVPVEIGVKPSG